MLHWFIVSRNASSIFSVLTTFAPLSTTFGWIISSSNFVYSPIFCFNVHHMFPYPGDLDCRSLIIININIIILFIDLSNLGKSQVVCVALQLRRCCLFVSISAVSDTFTHWPTRNQLQSQENQNNNISQSLNWIHLDWSL